MVSCLLGDLEDPRDILVILDLYDLNSAFVKVIKYKASNDRGGGKRIGGSDMRSRWRRVRVELKFVTFFNNP